MTMQHLLYCIFVHEKNSPTVRIAGVDGQPIGIVSHNGLSASVSPCIEANLTPDIARIQAYQKVIERFNHRRTIIPMRYGCLFPNKESIARHLGQRGRYYLSLLSELNGSVEMGIRVMMSARIGSDVSDVSDRSEQEAAPTSNTQFPPSGKEYLTARKAHYCREDHNLEETEQLIAQLPAAFSGLFLRFKSELAPTRQTGRTVSASDNPLLSLYFLVRRNSVESFREAFRRVASRGPHKLLLSGPWPPYNFVTLD